MGRSKRRAAVIAGKREARAIAATLGREARSTRRRRRLTQAALGNLVGLGQSEISHLERGNGAGASIETWVAIGMALDRPIAIGFGRDVVDPELRDAGHLAAQELVLRIAGAGGWSTQVEAQSDPARSWHATDVLLRHGDGTTVLAEIWNRLDDLGAALRSTDRKLADAATTPTPRSVWILVDTAANREIVRRYPTLLRSRFPGSSSAWVRAVAAGEGPPPAPGLIWADPHGGRRDGPRDGPRVGTLRPLRMSNVGRHTRSS
jgi:transcriptional regulator with XRE-family HTH domain